MAVYEHTRKYQVVKADKEMVRFEAPQGRKYWERWLSQWTAKSLFKRKLKVGDTVVFKRRSTSTSTWYTPSYLVKS